MWAIWLGIVILLVIIEISTSDLFTIWFIASGIITLILSLFVDNLTIQIGTFTILGVMLLFATRPLIKKYFTKTKVPTNLDRLIGTIGIVTEEITEKISGEVKVDGKRWTATSKEKLSEGSEVEILSIDGVKLKVKKKEEK